MNHREIWIKGAQLIDGSCCDLAIKAGHFVPVSEINQAQAEVIAADGLIAMPGLVDPHTHLREPGKEEAETIETGTQAAARGGYTCVHAMANLEPVTDTAEAVNFIQTVAAARAACEVVVVGAITKGLAGTELAELGLMHKAGVNIFSDDGKCVMDAQIMRRALTYVKAFDGVLAQHAQDMNLAGGNACCHESAIQGRLGLPSWPAQAESVIVARDVQLAELTNSRIHICHVSTAESVDIIRWAKARGIKVTAEATPHHLLLDTSKLASYDTVYKVNPPLRTDEHIAAVRAGLLDGTIDMVGTDHAPHAPEAKDHPFDVAAPGMLGLEQALAVLLEVFIKDGQMDWQTLAERMSYAPARLNASLTQGRPIAEGEIANLVLVDPSRRAKVDRENTASRSRNNPYHGLELPDPVELTIWAGKITHRRQS